ALLPVTGVIPLTQTIFLWQNLAMGAILIVISVGVAYFSAPDEEHAKVMRFGEPAETEDDGPAEPGRYTILCLIIGVLMLAYLVLQFKDKGGIAALDLNNFNLFFLAAGLLLHWRPRSFLRAVSKSIPATAGVIIQFPFYGGILGMISKTPMAERLAHVFVAVTTKATFPIVVAVYSAILGMVVPSGGGKWVVEAPYVMAAANAWHVHLGWTVQIYNAAEALPNVINPFWMLPLMGIRNVRARDLAGYSILQLMFHLPVVLLLAWFFAQTF